MRTTLNLPDGLLAEAKAAAARDGRTLTSLFEEGLRLVLAQQEAERLRDVEPLPTYGRPDGQVLVDLDDREALAAALDADGPR